jgi:hypothetical protein
MRVFVNSMVRFSAAVTLFSLQQMQNMANIAGTDSQTAIDNMTKALDSLTNALVTQVGEGGKPALESITRLGTDLVDRTWTGLNVSALDPREVMESSGDLLRKTTDSLAEAFKQVGTAQTAASEPQAAAQALGTESVAAAGTSA